MKARCKQKKDPETGKYILNGQAAKSALNKVVSDAGWYSLMVRVTCQAAKLGNWITVEEVPAHYSSQECS